MERNNQKKSWITNKLFSLFVLVLFFFAGSAFADAVSVDALSKGDLTIRDNQLKEIRDILRGGRGGYVNFGFNYTPFPSQLPLESQYGEHDGFAFRHHFAGFGSGEITKNGHLGALLWFERSGWDGEDFFLFPQYNDFSLARSVTTWGLTYTQSQLDMTLAGGMQHVNVEHVGNIYEDENDSLLYSWAHFRWGHASVQGSFHRKEWRHLRISLDLESRGAYGGRGSGPLTYLPNFDVTLYNGDEDDSVRVTWEQNLIGQRLYGEVSMDFPSKEFHSAALRYYPDPSRMVAFEATCLRRNEPNSSKLLWGGAIDLIFLRVGYNSSYEYERLFNAKGTFILEFKFDMATIDGFLFSRGAAKSAPLETMKLEQKNKDKAPEGDKFLRLDQGSDNKTLEASGIRYEKSGSTSAKGGK